MAGAPGTLPVEALEKMLSDLFGKTVGLKSIPRGIVEPPWVVSLYRGANQAVQVVGICDLPFACNAGAALSLMPVGVAGESLKAGRLSEALLENFQEVMNVAATFLSGHWSHVTLQQIVNPPDGAAPDLLRKSLTAKKRLDMEVAIPEYGGGKLSFAVV
jgi:hypothetical protein